MKILHVLQESSMMGCLSHVYVTNDVHTHIKEHLKNYGLEHLYEKLKESIDTGKDYNIMLDEMVVTSGGGDISIYDETYGEYEYLFRVMDIVEGTSSQL